MAHHTYKKIEVVGTSPNSIDEAIQNAVAKASKSVHKMRWFELVEARGAIDGDKVTEFQATVKIGFTLDD
ncbi:dodecin family protein [bacterium]|nr:dodecin family protein [bacterium]